MATVALVGTQWGDEGKGKIIDILAAKADMVVRAQGGNNAGHTVVNGGKTYKLRLVPSGILYENCDCIIAGGVVVDPKALLGELKDLTDKGVKIDRLRIDERAHVILPYHLKLDALSEKARGKGDIGTTGRGIGPCYTDRAERSGIRMYDFVHPEVFKAKLSERVKVKNEIIVKVYGEEPLNAEEIFKEYSEYSAILKKYVTDTSVLVYDAVKSGKSVLLEGAQGTLLDLGYGTYPYVTSSHPISGGFCVGAGIGPTAIDECIGVAKAYTTRVGKGPFPTELDDEVGERIRRVGAEFGTVTGRPRRCGWLDAVILRLAVRLNGLTSLSLNKLDTLSGIDELKVCVAYECDGKRVEHFPADIDELAKCKPIYESVKGWSEDISGAKKFEDLPENAQKYIKYVEKQIGCRISIIGVGPDRTQSIYR